MLLEMKLINCGDGSGSGGSGGGGRCGGHIGSGLHRDLLLDLIWVSYTNRLVGCNWSCSNRFVSTSRDRGD